MPRHHSTRKTPRRKRARVLLAAAAVHLGSPASARAAVNMFINAGTAGSWADSRNWFGTSGNRVPTGTDTVVVPVVATAPQQVNFDYDYLGSGAVAAPAAVSIDGTIATAAVLAQGGVSVTNLVTAAGTIGDLGRGTFNQTGGTAIFGSLVLGNQSGGIGTINNSGTGQVTVNGTGSSALYLGFTQGASGTISAAASLDASAVPVHVGYSGTGSLVVGGTALAGSLTVGTNATGSGSVTLSAGGTLGVAGTLTVGAAGSGLLTQSGGNLLIGSQLVISSAGGSATYNLSGGTITSTGLTNNGTINQTGGTATVGVVTGTGSLTVGGGTSAAIANITSFAQGTVTVSSNGTLALANNATRQSNTATTLVVNSGGKLDLYNNNLTVSSASTPFVNVRAAVVSGYNNGAYTGNGIMSSAAANSGGTVGVAVADGNDPFTAALGIVPAGKILVRPTFIGDTNFDGKVDSTDYLNLRSNFGSTFTSGAPASWPKGDFNYDNKVDSSDYLALRGNFGNSTTIPQVVTAHVATVAAKSAGTNLNALTSGTPSVAITLARSAIVLSPGGPNSPDVATLQMIVNPSTGDIQIKAVGGSVSFVSYEIDSTAGLLKSTTSGPSVWDTLTRQFFAGSSSGLGTAAPTKQWSQLSTAGQTTIISENTANKTDFEVLAAGATLDLAFNGQALWTGNSTQGGDLTFKYGVSDGLGGFTNIQGTVVVPEPTALAVMGLSSLLLLRRRRRATPASG